MAILRQQTSFGPGVYRGRPFTQDTLREYVEGTNKAIAAGIPIPLLKRHAPIDASDTATMQFAKEEGAGWLTKVGLDDTGAIWWEAKDVPKDVEQAKTEGRIRFTSPEFRPVYKPEKQGVLPGAIKMIRHMAFSIKPGNPHQGPIETIALDESPTAFQFSEDEKEPIESLQYSEGIENEDIWDKAKKEVGPEGQKYKGDSYWAVVSTVYKKMGGKYRSKASQHAEEDFTPKDKTKSRDDSDAPLEDKGGNSPGDANANNPDMPPKATDRSKLAAIIAGLAQKNVVVPSDWDPAAEGAMDILLGCLNSAIAAENKAKAESEPVDPDSEPVTDSPMPFSEVMSPHDLATHHGWNKQTEAGGIHTYAHPQKTGEVLHIRGNKWEQRKANGGIRKAGVGEDSLAAHLAHFHGSSQHSEQQPSFNGDSVMFTEQEIAAAPESLRAKMVAQNKDLADTKAKAEQFDEERRTTLNNTSREKAVTAVTAAKIPAGLKTKLLAGYAPTVGADGKETAPASIQFDEGEEQPTFTATQVAEMVAEALPKNFQFNEHDIKEVPAPKARKQVGVDPKGNPVYSAPTSEQFFEEEGDNLPAGHVSSERAEELVNANPVFKSQERTSRRQPLGEQVADNTRKYPSTMVE